MLVDSTYTSLFYPDSAYPYSAFSLTLNIAITEDDFMTLLGSQYTIITLQNYTVDDQNYTVGDAALTV